MTIFFAFLSTTTGAVHLKKVEACNGVDIRSDHQLSIEAQEMDDCSSQGSNKTAGSCSLSQTSATSLAGNLPRQASGNLPRLRTRPTAPRHRGARYGRQRSLARTNARSQESLQHIGATDALARETARRHSIKTHTSLEENRTYIPPFKPRIARFVNLTKIVDAKHRVRLFIGKGPATPGRLVRV